MSPAPEPGRSLTPAQRAVARRMHPDLGGDTAAYLAALAALPASGAVGPTGPGGQPTPGPPVTVRRTRWSRARSVLRRRRRRWVARHRSSRYTEL